MGEARERGGGGRGRSTAVWSMNHKTIVELDFRASDYVQHRAERGTPCSWIQGRVETQWPPLHSPSPEEPPILSESKAGIHGDRVPILPSSLGWPGRSEGILERQPGFSLLATSAAPAGSGGRDSRRSSGQSMQVLGQEFLRNTPFGSSVLDDEECPTGVCPTGGGYWTGRRNSPPKKKIR